MRNRLRRWLAQPNFSFFHFIILSIALLPAIAISSCSPSDGAFRMKGKFRNFNQGELYVYSLDGKARIDTIHLSEGKFSYLANPEDTVLLSVIFPNYSEIPVIAAPDVTVTMEGDASHLREVKVTGSDENDELTKFRLQVAEMTPPQAIKAAAAFVSEHPASAASLYILNKYFLLKSDADYNQAYQLLTGMVKARPDNRHFKQIQQQVSALRQAKTGFKLPKISVTDTKGRRVTNSDLKGELNIISVWASWSYESQSMQRELRRLQKQHGQRLGLLSICLDGNPDDCRKLAERDSLLWSVVCDGRMWEMPVISQLSITAVPDVLLTDRSGNIIARRLTTQELTKEVNTRLSK